MMRAGSTVANVQRLRFAQYRRDGALTVFPGGGGGAGALPFAVARVFTLGEIAAGGVRGRHAHRQCTQALVCLAGSAEVVVDDGRQTRRELLNDPRDGLLVPPGLWVEVTFAGPATLVAVFCDRPFDEADYVRDRAEFLRLRAAGAA
jgi:oxalate decarboxylase/phosphoglucose isomerase-like protein (cupin superfamily)